MLAKLCWIWRFYSFCSSIAIISSSSSVFIFRFERAMLGSASLAAPDLIDFSGYLFFDLPAEAVCSPADSC